ncbi:MAG: aminodeoxychorismate lyase [Gammaproteobacteria bacterium]|nr:aminodeoxychorismate lyase [Gammaproteobacteria bacterium]
MTEWYEVNRQTRAVDPSDRGFQYGDGLFETIAIRDGKPRQWQYHVERLNAGCERLGLELPGPSLELDLGVALARSNHDKSFCIAKIIVTSGSSVRGYGRMLPTPGEVYIGVFSATPLNKPAYLNGVATMLCETRLATGSPVAGMKTLNRIEQVLASSECLPTGAFEGFTLDVEDRLICGTISNVFIVKDKIVRTPSLDRCGVEGTMRRLVVRLLGQEGHNVEICDLMEEDLATADEVFITNSQMGAVPVHRCGNYKWSIGEQTREVMRLLANNGIDECRE